LIDGPRKAVRVPVGWRVVYGALGAAVAAWFLLRACSARDPEARLKYAERLGRWDDFNSNGSNLPVMWLHAASVGEVALAAAIVRRLRERVSGVRVLLTCNTPTGRAEALRAGVDEVRYLPVDFGPVVRRAVDIARPTVFAFVETEIWPTLLGEFAARSVPAAMFNARVSSRSFPRYRRIRPLVCGALESLVRVCARDRASADRLLFLGARFEATRVVGDVKLDAIDPSDVEATDALLDGRTGGRAVLLAISTHPGEEEMVLEAFGRLRDAGLSAALVLAPRHPERADAVSDLAASDWRVRRWSEGPPEGDWDVLVVDTTGDVRGFAKTAAAAFVGGSFVPVGGHNLFEPAAFGVPVAAGGHLDEVADQAETLTAAGCLEVVADAPALATVWRRWLESPEHARDVGAACRRTVEAHGGALARAVEEMAWLLRERGIHASVG
jgi:3-deoxy-D-manno-octulosonic-acid transferase